MEKLGQTLRFEDPGPPSRVRFKMDRYMVSELQKNAGEWALLHTYAGNKSADRFVKGWKVGHPDYHPNVEVIARQYRLYGRWIDYDDELDAA